MQRLPKKVVLFLLFVTNSILAPAQTKPRFIPEEESVMTASDVAKSLGLRGLYEWIESNASYPSEPLKLVMARQKLIQEVTIASLQIDATAGQIDAEIKELQNYLEGKRQREIDKLNLASLVAGGTLGTVSASLGLIGEGKASSITGIVAGGRNIWPFGIQTKTTKR